LLATRETWFFYLNSHYDARSTKYVPTISSMKRNFFYFYLLITIPANWASERRRCFSWFNCRWWENRRVFRRQRSLHKAIINFDYILLNYRSQIKFLILRNDAMVRQERIVTIKINALSGYSTWRENNERRNSCSKYKLNAFHGNWRLDNFERYWRPITIVLYPIQNLSVNII
jgi:hypothetical protein